MFFFLFSFYSALEVSGNDDEQIVDSADLQYHSGGRSIQMQQTTTTTDSSLAESNIGVPNRFCSVCGDTSTGKHRCFSLKRISSFYLKAFISVEIVAKVAKHSFVDLFNAVDIRITNVRTMVSPPPPDRRVETMFCPRTMSREFSHAKSLSVLSI